MIKVLQFSGVSKTMQPVQNCEVFAGFEAAEDHLGLDKCRDTVSFVLGRRSVFF